MEQPLIADLVITPSLQCQLSGPVLGLYGEGLTYCSKFNCLPTGIATALRPDASRCTDMIPIPFSFLCGSWPR